MQATASEKFAAGQQANETGRRLRAAHRRLRGGSFLAGICTRFPYPIHGFVVGIGFIALIGGAFQLIQQPLR